MKTAAVFALIVVLSMGALHPLKLSINSTSGKPVMGVPFALERTDLDPKRLRAAEAKAPGNGTIIGRLPVIYTEVLPSGPFVKAGMLDSGQVVDLGIVERGAYRIHVDKPGYVFESVEFSVDTPQEAEGLTHSIAAIAQTAVFTGLVTDQRGEPVPNAELHLGSLATKYEIKTDKNGFFFSDEILAGDYNLLIRANGYGKFSRKMLQLKPSSRHDENFLISRILTGTTLLTLQGVDGKGLHSANISGAYDGESVPRPGSSQWNFYSMIRDAHSEYANPGNKLDSYLTHYLKNEKINDVLSQEKLKHPQGLEPPVTLVAGPGAPMPDFYGNRVLNDVIRENIFQDKLEDTFGQEPKESFSGTTDGNGQIEASGLREGKYKLRISKNGLDLGEYAFYVKQGLVLEKKVLIEGTTIPLVGRLVDEAGEAVQGATCRIDDLPSVGNVVTGSDGTYIFGHVNQGKHVLLCSKNGFEEKKSEFKVSEREVTLSEGESRISKTKKLSELTLSWKRGERRLMALAVGVAKDGQPLLLPVTNAKLRVTPDFPGVTVTPVRGAPGLYTIGGLRTSEAYTVTIDPPEESRDFPTVSKSQVILDTDSASVGKKISPLERLKSLGFSIGTYAAGSRTYNPEAARFYANHADYAFYEYDGIGVSTPSVSISGVARNEAGIGVGKATVVLKTAGGSWKVESGSEGEFAFERIPFDSRENAGLWGVTADAEGYLRNTGLVRPAAAAEGNEAKPSPAGFVVDFKSPMVRLADGKEKITTLFGQRFELSELVFSAATKPAIRISGKYQFGLKDGPPTASDARIVANFRAEIALSETNAPINSRHMLNATFGDALASLAFYTDSDQNILPAGARLLPKKEIIEAVYARFPGGGKPDTMAQCLEVIIAKFVAEQGGEYQFIDSTLKNTVFLFDAGEYAAVLQRMTLRTGENPATAGFPIIVTLKTKVEADGALNELGRPSENLILPTFFVFKDAFIKNNLIDLANASLMAKNFQFYVDSLGQVVVNAGPGGTAQFQLDLKSLKISIQNAKYLIPDFLSGNHPKDRLKHYVAGFVVDESPIPGFSPGEIRRKAGALVPDVIPLLKDESLTMPINVTFSLAPSFEITAVETILQPDTYIRLPLAGRVSAPKASKRLFELGLPYHLHKFDYNVKTREIQTSGRFVFNSKSLKSCTGEPLAFGVDRLNLNFSNFPDVYGPVSMSKEPAEFSLFGGSAIFQDYDLQITGSAWQMQGDVVLTFSGGACSSGETTGGMVLPKVTVGYDAVNGFFINNSYKAIPPNQKINVRKVGLNLQDVRFYRNEAGKQVMTINGPVALNLIAVQVQASNVHFTSEGEFSCDMFKIRAPVLWDASGFIAILPTGGLSGGLMATFLVGQFDFQFTYVNDRQWSFSLQLPVIPGVPARLTNARAYVSASEAGYRMLASGDWMVPMGAALEINDLTLLIDTAGLVQVSASLQIAHGILRDVKAQGTVQFRKMHTGGSQYEGAPAVEINSENNERHMSLRLDIAPPPMAAMVLDFEKNGANMYVGFDSGKFLVGRGVSVSLKIIPGVSFASGQFIGHAVPAKELKGFSYNYKVKSPDLVGNGELNGVYMVFNKQIPGIGFDFSVVKMYFERNVAAMVFIGKQNGNFALTAGVLTAGAVALDVNTYVIDASLRVRFALDGGVQVEIPGGLEVGVAFVFGGKVSIKLCGLGVGSVWVKIQGDLTMSTSRGVTVENADFDFDSGSVGDGPAIVVPTYNITAEMVADTSKKIGGEIAQFSEGAFNSIKDMCIWEGGPVKCMSCMRLMVRCSPFKLLLGTLPTTTEMNTQADKMAQAYKRGGEDEVRRLLSEQSKEPELTAPDENNSQSKNQEAANGDGLGGNYIPDPGLDANAVRDEDLDKAKEGFGTPDEAAVLAAAAVSDDPELPRAEEYEEVLGVTAGEGKQSQINLSEPEGAEDTDKSTGGGFIPGMDPNQDYNDFVMCVLKTDGCQLAKGTIGYYLLAIRETTGHVGESLLSKKMDPCRDSRGRLKKTYTQGARDATCRNKVDGGKGPGIGDSLAFWDKGSAMNKYLNQELLQEAKDLNARMEKARKLGLDVIGYFVKIQNQTKKIAKSALDLKMRTSVDAEAEGAGSATAGNSISAERASTIAGKEANGTDSAEFESKKLVGDRLDLNQQLAQKMVKFEDLMTKRKIVSDEYKKIVKQYAVLKAQVESRMSQSMMNKLKNKKNTDREELKEMPKLLRELKQSADNGFKVAARAKKDQETARVLIEECKKSIDGLYPSAQLRWPDGWSKKSLLSSVRSMSDLDDKRSFKEKVLEQSRNLGSKLKSAVSENEALNALANDLYMMFDPISPNISSTKPNPVLTAVRELKGQYSATDTDKGTRMSTVLNQNLAQAFEQFYVNAQKTDSIAVTLKNPALFGQTYRVDLTRNEACPIEPTDIDRVDSNGKRLKVKLIEAESVAKEEVNLRFKNDDYDYICWYSRKAGQTATRDDADMRKTSSGKVVAANKTWVLRQLMILKPGQTLDFSGAKQAFEDYIKKIRDDLTLLASSIDSSATEFESTAMQTADFYNFKLADGRWSTLILTLMQNPATRPKVLSMAKKVVNTFARDCKLVSEISDDLTSKQDKLTKIPGVAEVQTRIQTASALCAKIDGLGEILTQLEVSMDPPAAAALTQLGGLPFNLSNLEVDNAGKNIRLQGSFNFGIANLPESSAAADAKVVIPVDMKLELPNDVMLEIADNVKGKLTKIQAIVALLSNFGTMSQPKGVPSSMTGSEQKVLLSQIRESLGLIASDAVGMFNEYILQKIRPEYSYSGDLLVQQLGPYELKVTGFAVELRGLRYVPRIDSLSLRLTKNPATLFGSPFPFAPNISLDVRNIAFRDGKIDFSGRYSGPLPSISPDTSKFGYGTMSLDNQSNFALAFPSGIIVVNNILQSFSLPQREQNANLPEEYRGAFEVQLAPYRIRKLDLIKAQTGKRNDNLPVPIETLFNRPVVLRKLSLDKDSRVLDIQATISLNVSAGRVLKVGASFQRDISYSTKITLPGDDPRTYEAFSNVLKLIQTESNNVPPDFSMTVEELRQFTNLEKFDAATIINAVYYLLAVGQSNETRIALTKTDTRLFPLNPLMDVYVSPITLVFSHGPALAGKADVEEMEFKIAADKVKVVSTAGGKGKLIEKEVPVSNVMMNVTKDGARIDFDYSKSFIEFNGLSYNLGDWALIDSGLVRVDFASATIEVKDARFTLLKTNLVNMLPLGDKVRESDPRGAAQYVGSFVPFYSKVPDLGELLLGSDASIFMNMLVSLDPMCVVDYKFSANGGVLFSYIQAGGIDLSRAFLMSPDRPVEKPCPKPGEKFTDNDATKYLRVKVVDYETNIPVKDAVVGLFGSPQSGGVYAKASESGKGYDLIDGSSVTSTLGGLSFGQKIGADQRTLRDGYVDFNLTTGDHYVTVSAPGYAPYDQLRTDAKLMRVVQRSFPGQGTSIEVALKRSHEKKKLRVRLKYKENTAQLRRRVVRVGIEHAGVPAGHLVNNVRIVLEGVSEPVDVIGASNAAGRKIEYPFMSTTYSGYASKAATYSCETGVGVTYARSEKVFKAGNECFLTSVPSGIYTVKVQHLVTRSVEVSTQGAGGFSASVSDSVIYDPTKDKTNGYKDVDYNEITRKVVFIKSASEGGSVADMKLVLSRGAGEDGSDIALDYNDSIQTGSATVGACYYSRGPNGKCEVGTDVEKLRNLVQLTPNGADRFEAEAINGAYDIIIKAVGYKPYRYTSKHGNMPYRLKDDQELSVELEREVNLFK